MSVPLRITGPAVVVFNGVTYYFQDGLKGSLKRNTENITVDNFGAIAAVAQNFIVGVTGKPAGGFGADYIGSIFPRPRHTHRSSWFRSTRLSRVPWAQHSLNVLS